MKRDNCFDFLRFLFAFNVVLGHLAGMTCFPQFEFFRNITNTHLSVTGFFVISGFLIYQSYEHSSSLSSYFIKRMKRLLPAYWLVVIICAFGLVFLSTYSAEEYFLSKDWWQYLGANLCFLNFLHPSLPGVFENEMVREASVNPALWTLKIEVGFYLILPALVWWLRKSKKPWVVLLLIYICAVVYRTCFGLLGAYRQNAMYVFLARQLPGFMSYFAAGMAVYMYKDIFLKYKKYLILPALVIFGAEYYLGKEILSPLAWGVIVLWAAYSLRSLNNFAKYGDISYGIYIYHAPILKIILTLGIFSQLGVWPTALLYITCVIVIGFASWHLWENRFLQRK